MTQLTVASAVCRMCGTSQKMRGRTLARHTASLGLHCPGSGKTCSEIDDLLRTFDCWENTKEVTRRTLVVDEGDSVSLINTMRANGVEVSVSVRIESVSVPRLIDELGVIARERGWRQ
jgi:hypothetical protein